MVTNENRFRLFDMINDKLADMGHSFIHIIPPSFTIAEIPENFGCFEPASRTCYKSENKIDEGTDVTLFNKILDRRHTAMIEFLPDMVVKFITDRGVSHEMVRHRHCSFAQESTRYVTYNNHINFILPWTLKPETLLAYLYDESEGKQHTHDKMRYGLFMSSCTISAANYQDRLRCGEPAQEARGALTQETSTTIWVKANMREWLHIFDLRADSSAHPNYRMLASGLFSVCENRNPDIFNNTVKDSLGIVPDLMWFEKGFDLHKEHNTYHVIPKLGEKNAF